MTISRMQRLHRVRITPDEKRALIKYLSDEQGLAPAEVKPFSYLLERRDWVSEEIQDQRRQALCARCHSYARIALQRRTEPEWIRLVHFHLGAFPTIEYQAGGRNIAWFSEAQTVARGLARDFPLETDSWRNWKRRPWPTIAGKFGLVGYQPGKGAYTGEVVLSALGHDLYREVLAWEFDDGSKVSGAGQGILYTGFGWRSSLKLDDGRRIREVLQLSQDGQILKGRWFLPPHDELGGDETLYAGEEPRVLTVSPMAVKRSRASVTVRISGMNFPSDIGLNDIDLGKGLRVEKLIQFDRQAVVIRLSVDAQAPIGKRDVSVGAAHGARMLTVYDQVDYIRIDPERALARTGGTTAPKQLQQFEAIAYSNGPDGQKETDDDLRLGPVPAKWEMMEFHTTTEDDDVNFVGSINQSGLFTPADEGPNPRRRFHTNNVGDVWIEATYRPADGATLKARAYLIVTVPRWVKPPLR